jgi:translation initiation factor 2B subunit (eIF-2B alpha/beta/delta family)
MATSPQSITTRTVVLLRPSERKRLEKLAAAESVSSGEILRRSLQAYEQQISASEQATIATLLSEMNSALDEALASIRSARSEVRESLDKIAKLQASRA